MLTGLDASLLDRPDAIGCGDRSWSGADLRSAAADLVGRIGGARALAVVADASLETIAAVVAGLDAGIPVVPLPPDAGPMERDHILVDSGAELLLDGAALTELAPPGRAPIPDGTALIVYTSGTTGAPKGVTLSRAAIAADLDGLADAWGWSAEDLLVHGLPLFHVHGLVLGVLGALRVGSRLVHTVRPRPQDYARAGGSLYFGVPTVWSRVCAEPDAARSLAGARALVSGSAALPIPVFQDIERLTGHRPIERYGMTETLITLSSRASGQQRPGCVGGPLTGIRTRIADEQDGIGELQLSGPTLFSGYLNRPEATAECLTADGWFRTGDVAAIDADGQHRIVGRASQDLIKTGGYRIGAGEVENALLAHPAVAEAAVIGVPDADLGQQIVAYVVAEGADEEQLIDFVATGLSVHKRPRRVHFVQALPRNAMGKVQKSQLRSDQD